MSEIYLIIVEDRHIDVQVTPHTNKDTAIKAARVAAVLYCKGKDDYKEHDIDGWLFCAVYSPEGDRVRVISEELVE